MEILASGSQAAVINTKHQLHTSSTANVVALIVDTYNMALGDALELYVDVACESGGTHRQAYYNVFSNNQADPAKISVPVVAPYGFTCHLKQIAGTGRTFKWVVSAV